MLTSLTNHSHIMTAFRRQNDIVVPIFNVNPTTDGYTGFYVI